MMPDSNAAPQGFARLRELLDRRRRRQATERCEFCGAEIAPEHGHVVNVAQRALLCVCRPCYLLFTHDGAAGGRFRAVPDRYQRIEQPAIDGGLLESLRVPVGVAFFFRNSASQRVIAFYPSPAGATESELTLDAWTAIVAAAPLLETMAPDVEALLVRRQQDGRSDAFLVPIDACYELTGRIRREWRGFQGGDSAWRAIEDFFARVADRARGTVPA